VNLKRIFWKKQSSCKPCRRPVSTWIRLQKFHSN